MNPIQEHHSCAFNLSMGTLVAFGTVVFLSSPMINFYLPHLTLIVFLLEPRSSHLVFHHFGEARHGEELYTFQNLDLELYI